MSKEAVEYKVRVDGGGAMRETVALEEWEAPLDGMVKINADAFVPERRPVGLWFLYRSCLLYTSPSPRDGLLSRMPSSA